MRPDYKKWRQAPEGKKPFQASLFFRTETGRTVEVASDRCTPDMKRAVLTALYVLSTGEWPDVVTTTSCEPLAKEPAE